MQGVCFRGEAYERDVGPDRPVGRSLGESWRAGRRGLQWQAWKAPVFTTSQSRGSQSPSKRARKYAELCQSSSAGFVRAKSLHVRTSVCLVLIPHETPWQLSDQGPSRHRTQAFQFDVEWSFMRIVALDVKPARLHAVQSSLRCRPHNTGRAQSPSIKNPAKTEDMGGDGFGFRRVSWSGGMGCRDFLGGGKDLAATGRPYPISGH